jgi:hypothetical protein
MVVQPDILSHWKIQALCAQLGTGEALTAILGLWAHCQNSRAWVFRLSPIMLSGICRYAGPENLLRVLVECQLLDDRQDGTYEVHDWAEKNAVLVRNWTAWSTHQGKKSLKTPPKLPLEESEEPPKTPFGGVDKIRVDKRRVSLGSAVASQEEIPGFENPDSPPDSPPALPKPPRVSDGCFEALCIIQGSTLSNLTKSERGRLNAALAEIRAACPGLTPAEIRRRADAYRVAMPGATLTASALAAHWSRLVDSSPPDDNKKSGGAARHFQADTAPAAPDGWQDAFEAIYDIQPRGEWHQQQVHAREAVGAFLSTSTPSAA